MKYNIENKLKTYFPVFFELLDNNPFDWFEVGKCFGKKADEYAARQERVNTSFPIQSSLFIVIKRAVIDKEPGAIRLFEYMRNLFEQLADRTTPEEKKLITTALFGVMTNVDMKYLNFLGELSVLTLLKMRLPITLLETERPLVPDEPDGTKIDFHFLNRESNNEYLVEIVNLHLTEKNTSTDEFIERLLDQKIRGKLLDTGIGKSKAFLLFPVLWGYWNEIKAVADYYRDKRPEFENTGTPCCFVPFSDESGKPVYKFGTIDTIFESSTVS
ncbi:MAG TPA: hypothetical protein VGM31_06220 [Puia sp.]